MTEELRRLLDPASITPWQLILAILTVLTAWIAANYARRAVFALLGRIRGLSETARSLTSRLVKYAVILIGIGTGLSFLGASVQPLIAVSIIVGVILAMALRGLSDNIAAGLILQTRQPVHIGDLVECDSRVGVVAELNARSVVITTLDGIRAHIPNSYLLARPLLNHSTGGGRRSEIEIRASRPDLPIAAVLDLVRDAARAVPGVRTEPDIQVLATQVATDRVTLRLRFWHDPIAYAPVCSGIVVGLDHSLGAHGLTLTVTSQLAPPPLTTPPAI